MPKLKQFCYFLLFFIFGGIPLYGQTPPKRILVDFKGISDNQNTFILDQLKTLKYTNTPQQNNLFEEVLEMATFQNQADFLTNYRLLLDVNSVGAPAYYLDSRGQQIQQKVLNQLLYYDYLLRIEVSKETVIQERQIFKFVLFEVIKGKPATPDSAGVLAYPITTSNILRAEITITNLADRATLLSNTLKQLFPVSNVPPIAVISINKEKKESKTYYLALGDSVLVSSELSTDLDSKRSSFRYLWEQLDLQGNFNIPNDQIIPIVPNLSTQYLKPPKVGDYLLLLTVNDGAINSSKDSLYLKVIERPQLALSHTRFPKRRQRESLFQFLSNPNTYKRIVKDTIQVTLANPANTSFVLDHSVIKNYREKARHAYFDYNILTTDSTTYGLALESTLKGLDSITFDLQGIFENVKSIPAYYYLYRPERKFFDIKLGTELFLGPASLGFLSDTIGFFTPSFSTLGTVYLAHWDYPASAIALESGFSFLTGKAKNNINQGIIGKVALRMESYYAKNGQLGSYLALQLIGFTQRLPDNTLQVERHYGLGLGFMIKPLNLEIDMINLYHNFQPNGFSMSWGFRFNLGKIFFRNRLLR